MSTINTNGLDVNYPIPGQNNNTQGFRNNFTNIKQNLNIASNEISDLQNKAVLKSALANSVLNNDMANTLISNCSTLQFRATTYNLGNALIGSVLVDCSLGDLQYGTLSGNIVLDFGSWTPTNTQSTVKLQLSRPNNQADYSIIFPSQAIFNNNNGWPLIENSNDANSQTTLTFPYDVTQVDLTLTSTDCGNSISVIPTNRPFKTTQVQLRTPSPTGFLGDVAGTVAADSDYFYVCTGSYDANTTSLVALTTTVSTNVITFNSSLPGNVVVNMPVIFDTMTINGNVVSSFGNINEGQTYYVKSISGANITISDTRSGGIAGTTLALTTVSANATTSMDATFYNGTDIWKRIQLTNW